jgi:predicted O-linked N-acetylglucosamine transferase (SPINDLY family)
MPAVALAQGIAQDKLDVLVDLSGLTAGHRLDALAARPAPAMVTYLGYPHTTGLPGMDYRIVDAVTDPTNQTPAGTEALARLDPCFVCFRPPEGPPAPKAPPADAPTTFVSFNALTKLNDPLLRLWARVLAAAPRSRLLLKNRECYTPDVRAHLLARCAAAGMDPARVDIAEPTKGIGEHLAVYHRGAVALDSFPYGGTTTTCEALWMGLPVVTLAGPVHASRVGASLLNAAGLGHLVAHTEEEFVRIATEAAQADHARVRALVRSAFEASPAMDEHGFARRFGGLLKAIASTARA